ncbi:hypothetical protein [Lacihabitans soyangensis]|uniref:Uncharacterized protein n=1 Tax=Lacihabitans soyangensis TaxID=869394 RepID=A0AAE3H4M3_9BACT|nr:hypothetical protein [Lacihabitans soyangensis]MCP9764867.1 hypothetical protein [Lacihabitans soyangensis]
MNPIDDFFREKLKNHEVTPSERANQLFLSKLESKKKKKPVPYWYFALAASLFIVSLVGVYYYHGQDDFQAVLTTTEEQNSSAETNENKDLAEASNPKVMQVQKTGTQPAELKRLNLNSTGEDAFSYSSEVVSTNEKIVQTGEKKEMQAVDNKKLEEFFETENNVKMAIVEEARQNKLEETLIYLTPILAVNQVNTFKGSPNIPENTKTSSDEYFSDDKSLVTRVLDEVKHLKKGEKVDFNKLGFKPIEELALDKEGFIVSETNQIKDKINWIKARLNNN